MKEQIKPGSIVVVDIDGVVMETAGMNYEEAIPIQSNIDKINKLYDMGCIIDYFTARGTVTGIDYREVTEKQFERFGIKYHSLTFGKPTADVYIDDKALNIADLK